MGTGRFRTRHRMRCRVGKQGCGRRFTLPRHPLAYKREPRCKYCKGTNLQDCEQYRRNEKEAAGVCNCDGYPFPHTIGNFPMRMCDRNPLFVAGIEPTTDEWESYQCTIETARSSIG